MSIFYFFLSGEYKRGFDEEAVSNVAGLRECSLTEHRRYQFFGFVCLLVFFSFFQNSISRTCDFS